MNWPDLTKLTDPTKGDAEEVQPAGHEVNPYAPGEADGSSRQADRPSFMLLVLGIVILVSALGCMAFAAMLPGMVRPDAPGRLVAQILFCLNLIAVCLFPFGVIAIAAHFAIAKMRRRTAVEKSPANTAGAGSDRIDAEGLAGQITAADQSSGE